MLTWFVPGGGCPISKEGNREGIDSADAVAAGGSKAKIILLAAPKAEGYYGKVGFSQHRSAWVWDGKA